VSRVEDLARRPDLRFFHWEVEFPEVFFGFVGIDERQVRHRDRIEEGSAGFDVVIGNPPYVRQEVIKPLKAFLKASYRTYNSTNDLYVYFQEQEIRNLRVGGRMGMIVANKWMRAGYGEGLRDYLQRTGQPLEVIDFGHAPIFPDADTFPCILLMTRRPAPLEEKARLPEKEMMGACEVPREYWNERMDLGAFVASRRHSVPTRLLRKEGWSLEDPRVLVLLEKIRNSGVPLKDYARCSPLMGLKTGLNEAFIVDAATRDRLVKEDARSVEVIRPLLRGRDAARWRSRDSGHFLITIPSSENRDWPWSDAGAKAEATFRATYPAICNHFQPFRQALIDRQDQGRFFWELRSCDYMDEFDRPKIFYQDLAWVSDFSQDSGGRIPNNTVYFIPSSDKVLLAILNSPVLWWYMWRTAQHDKDETLRLFTDFVVTIPIPQVPRSAAQAIESLVKTAEKTTEATQAFEVETLESASATFSVPPSETKIISWLSLPADVFATRLFRLAEIKKPTPKMADEVANFHQQARARQVELLTRQLDLERKLAALVEDAYGLDAEDRALLRASRPVRDPLDVLEAKIRGQGGDHQGSNED
jgi:Eco57I restriction-modification methylase